MHKVDVATGTATSVNLKRASCIEDKLKGSPAVQLYNYSNPGFQSAMVAAHGGPDDLIFVTTATGCSDDVSNRVIALYASNLTVRWVFNQTGTSLMGDASDGCDLDYPSNSIFCGTEATGAASTLWSFNTVTGAVKWSTNAGSIQNRPRVSSLGGAGRLYVVANGNEVQKRDATTGALMWVYPTTANVTRNIWPEFRTGGPSDRIFMTDVDGMSRAILDGGGSAVPHWGPLSPGGGIKFTSMPVVATVPNVLWLGRSDGNIQQLDASTGTLGPKTTSASATSIWDPSLDVSAPAVTSPDRLLVTYADGTLARYCIPWSGTTAVPDPLAVTQFGLVGVPNPTSGLTRLTYVLPHPARVEIGVFDVGGHRVRSLVRVNQPAGRHEHVWDGADDSGRPVASGLYFYRLRVQGQDGQRLEQSQKVEVVR